MQTATYGGLGRLTQLDITKDGQDPKRIDYSYDAQGQLTGRAISVDNTLVVTTTMTRDSLGRLTGLEHRKADNTLLASFTGFNYSDQGKLTDVTRSVPTLPAYNGVLTFTYNDRGELVEEKLQPDGQPPVYTYTYAYDAAGNPTTFQGQTHTYNDNNQLTDQGYGYGAQGHPDPYGGVSLDFDGAGHLTDYGTTLDAGYRADGLRAWKDSGAGRTYYVYDGETLVAELDGNGTVTSTNTWGADGLVMRGEEIYLCDPLGNVAVRLDLTGTVLASDAYDAWGNLLACKDPQGNDYTLTGDPYGYKAQYGYYTDRETGLILCTHRYYDPGTGRWLTRDPIGYEGGINLYQYCGNDPVNGVDPEGKFAPVLIAGALIVLSSDAALVGTTIAIAGVATYITWDSTRDARATLRCLALLPYAETPVDVIDLVLAIRERDCIGIGVGLFSVALPYFTSGMVSKQAREELVVVVGENVDRVKEFAKKIGAEVYHGLDKFNELSQRYGDDFAQLLGRMHNAEWARKVKQLGATVIDIGPDFARRIKKNKKSINYEIERRIFLGYERYKRVFERSGKVGGVRGLDHYRF